MESLATPRIGWIAFKAMRRHGAIQKPVEFGRVLRYLGQHCLRSVMEIGTRRGGSLYAFSQLAQSNAHIVSLDWHTPGTLQPDLLKQLVRPKQELTCIQGNSHEAAIKEKVKTVVREPLDLLFIDGDHRYEGVRDDFVSFSPLVKPGGIVLFHDIVENPQHPEYGVERLWRELEGKKLEFVDRIDPSPGAGLGILVMPK